VFNDCHARQPKTTVSPYLARFSYMAPQPEDGGRCARINQSGRSQEVGSSWDREPRLQGEAQRQLLVLIFLRSNCGRASRAQNLVGSVKDALGRPFADRLPLSPRLDIASAELRTRQAQRFTAKQGYGLGFHFRHGARCLIRIRHIALIAVEQCMGNFMEKGLVGSAAIGLTAIFRPRLA
jgi:hypothetical protein